jgi:tetratricopeptide (TPR) repeat protein
LLAILRIRLRATGWQWSIQKRGQIEEALREFKTLIEQNPDYTPAYFMAAQTLATASRIDEAKRWLVDGISSARRTGNAHAQSEMTAMLEELS